MTYKFYYDVEVSVWNRTPFIIEADSKEEAIELAKEQFENPIEIISENVCEVLYETEIPTDKEDLIFVNDDDSEEIIDSKH